MRKWSDGGWNAVRNGEEPKETIPDVLSALLSALNEKYPKFSTDSGELSTMFIVLWESDSQLEKRKTWIYEVPLSAVHHLREALNAIPPGDAISSEMLEKYDAPVIASAIKLWALELDPPLGLYEGWEDFRRLYPSGEFFSPALGYVDSRNVQLVPRATKIRTKVSICKSCRARY